MKILAAIAILAVIFLLFNLAWRWGSRQRSLPCPTALAWMLDHPILQKLNGTQTTLERLRLKPGQRILEIGPGPGRLLIPTAKRVLPDGEVVGVDIQGGMLERLRRKAEREGIKNLTTILGDAAKEPLPPASFDTIFLCTVLGEIPDREGALKNCFQALKPGGLLSITEMAGDPHYQSRSKVRHLATEAGFLPQEVLGSWYFFTANFTK
ncbi:MAG: class I SAM-dependent methyltransferase [Planctomycetota bacterium]